MKRLEKGILLALLSALLTAAFSLLSFAYSSSDKAIKSVAITVTGYVELDTRIGEEQLEIETSGNRYDYSYYEVQNEGFTWTEADTPELKIYLTAADGYYFHITKGSQIKLTGATYVSATREDSAYTLVVDVKLPSMSLQVGEVKDSKMTGGVCTWDAAPGAGSYELKFMRSGTTLGGIQTLTELTYDGSRYMTKSGDYHFMVRALNKKDPTIKSRWLDSNHWSVSTEAARNQQEANAKAQSDGSWTFSVDGWRFTAKDGTLLRNCWRQINGKWYAFDERGYLRTGWFSDGGKWYYLDPENGFMWKNAVTPDGYVIGIDGVMSGSTAGISTAALNAAQNASGGSTGAQDASDSGASAEQAASDSNAAGGN